MEALVEAISQTTEKAKAKVRLIEIYGDGV